LIVERVYRQRCWPQFAGVEEDVLVYRHRVRNPGTSEVRHQRKRHRAPQMESQPSLFWWLNIDLVDEAGDDTAEPAWKAKRSLHPGKVTRAEKATWVKLPKGWDDGAAKVRGDCAGDRACPWCLVPVAMRVNESVEDPATDIISCPECKGIVGYHAGGDGDWSWCRATIASKPGTIYDASMLPMTARNHCRPCVWARCRHHLYLEVKDCGSMKLNHKGVTPERMCDLADTCSHDVADRVEEEGVGKPGDKKLALEVVGAKLGLTLERARQLEAQALQEVNLRNRRADSNW
jgi:hypothetical protein